MIGQQLLVTAFNGEPHYAPVSVYLGQNNGDEEGDFTIVMDNANEFGAGRLCLFQKHWYKVERRAVRLSCDSRNYGIHSRSEFILWINEFTKTGVIAAFTQTTVQTFNETIN